MKKKPKDYFTGVIRHKAANSADKWVDLIQIKGTYLGWIEFDGMRYWDLRETKVQSVDGFTSAESATESAACDYGKNVLPSDCRYRADSIQLK